MISALLAAGCGSDETKPDAIPLDLSDADSAGKETVPQPFSPPGTVNYSEDREACTNASPWRNLYFGELHSHTAFSFDARSYDTVVTPAEAYAFAQGAPVKLPPLDADGKGTRTVKLGRPLDFAALTDHSEYLGETYTCVTKGEPGYDSPTCQAYRDPEDNGAYLFGTPLSSEDPQRFTDVCGEDLSQCAQAAKERWQQLQDAAEGAYDRSPECTFTSIIAYEYSNTLNISNLHRNVFFRNHVVPESPISLFEAPSPPKLWDALDQQCALADNGCDVIAIPHNSNLSNGNLFYVDPKGVGMGKQLARARQRARLEPLAEIFQHKGDMECRNGFPENGGETDPMCEFEKARPPDDEVCPDDEPGLGGMRLWGCVHKLDFLRNVLKFGLLEEQRIGVNPYRLGFVGSTDTHNGTPGMVEPYDFQGHIGLVDDTPKKRLGSGTVTHDGIINMPGGITAVWAVENSRDAIFDALKRREIYATSGPRIELRFFAGFGYDDSMCNEPDALPEAGYFGGVPMGGLLAANADQGPLSFLVFARQDPGTEAHPGVPLQRVQVIKGWLDADGKVREQVFEVAGDPDNGADVDTSTCEPTGEGLQSLCTVWTDPDFATAPGAFYYARVIENPSCRWSTRKCLSLRADEVPAGCTDGSVADTVQHRAWSSPIWVE